MIKSMIKKLEKKMGRSRRKTVPRAERVGSLVILVLVLGVGVAVAIKGEIYDPGRYELNEAALAGTAGEVAGYVRPAKAESVPAAEAIEGYGAQLAPASGDAAQGQVAGLEQLAVGVVGTRPFSETEFYDPDNLYIKINGRADAYLAFNFERLRSRSFELTDSPDGAYVDVYAYEMGEPINAYGIFALERDPKGAKLDFGEDAYRSGMGYFLRQGSVYLQVLASDQSEATLAKTEEIARELTGRITPGSDGLEGRLSLPEAGQVPGTAGFEPQNAQGLAFLSNVFSADYVVEEKTLRFFIAVEVEEAAAQDVFDQYKAFCEQFGEVSVEESQGAQILKAEMFGTWKIIYRLGVEVGGVIDTENPDVAVRFIEGLLAEK